ncbi:hypothetical protein FSP39_020412 [Pinctada imbricata]|uniref:Medium-chain acyl-CoA ligase ACSF2, mitochondrial n=1 Tax=Pinctada imbricata TaxID=66713 RepID=A0AA89BX49_PINIB|nr:hypothetical protein FSP39_020412 [Pinctada imbricata]
MASGACSSYMRGDGLRTNVRIYNTIPDVVKQYSLDKDRIAQIYIDWQSGEKETLLYKTIYDNAKRFACGLMKQGIRKGDIIGIGTDNIQEWMFATVGVQMCGAIPLHFVFQRIDGKDIEDILTVAGDACKAIILPPGKDDVNVSVLEQIFSFGTDKGSISSNALPSMQFAVILSMQHTNDKIFNMSDVMTKEEVELPQLDPDDAAGLFMTSGTTGSSKLVIHSHRNMLIFGHHAQIIYGLDNDKPFNDRSFCWLGGYPQWEFFTGKTRTLVKNISQVPSMAKYLEVVQQILKDGDCNSAFMILPLLQEILRQDYPPFNIHSLVASGQPVPSNVLSVVGKVCTRFASAYGMTEFGIGTWKEVQQQSDFADYEAGFPLPGVEIKVTDGDLCLVDRGEDGEVWVRSSLPILGYWNDPDKTNQMMTKSGWCRTGDVGKMTDQGSLIVKGRISDSMVKIGPRFVSVASIECKLKMHVGISDVVVFSYVDKKQYHCVCCAIKSKGNGLSKSDLDEYLLDKEHRTEANFLKKLELPRSYVFLEDFPRTYSGKVNRKKVAEICKEILLKEN